LTTKRRLVPVLGILVLVAVAGCGFIGSRNPSSILQDADLVGAWGLSYGRQGRDLLYLRADGTFKQIYTDRFTAGYRFETPWEQWWLERFPDGTVRLHLQGARYYRNGIRMAEEDGLWPELPSPLSGTPGPAGAPPPYPLLDIFANQWVEAPRQLVLDVRQMPSGELVLFHLLDGADDGYSPFYFSGDVFRRIEARASTGVPCALGSSQRSGAGISARRSDSLADHAGWHSDPAVGSVLSPRE
jgi:hypothetical protein